jgi:hypothetical protein
MTAPTFLRRRVATRRPRPVLVDVRNYWRVTDAGSLREVLVRTGSGRLVTTYLPDEHPALVRFFERAAVAA